MILFTTLFTIYKTETSEIYCENDTEAPKEKEKTCKMDKTTSIDFPNTTISKRDEKIVRLTFYKNKKIFFLPENVSASFPNLTTYDASECNITEIWKKNFQGLSKLNSLSLNNNQIKMIATDTFVDLTLLALLYLGENNFTFQNYESQFSNF
jgi:Leucine-rich repeat (LRR) protein